MKATEKLEKAFSFFKKSYSYKMGGTQTVILPNGKSKYFDDREYYSGRGSKYNSSISHDIIGDVKVSRKDYSEFLAYLKKQEIQREKQMYEFQKKKQRIELAKNNGIYSITDDGYVELTDSEQVSQTFDYKRLAKTLKISIEDAKLLNSTGKTYVFAKSKDGKLYLLFHPSLSCNELSIHIKETTYSRLNEFNHDEWASAPFAGLVGQKEAKNHFVC